MFTGTQGHIKLLNLKRVVGRQQSETDRRRRPSLSSGRLATRLGGNVVRWHDRRRTSAIPFQRQRAVFGLIPGAFNKTAFTQAATALFAANDHEARVMFKGLPTSISYRENCSRGEPTPMFDFELTKALFRYPAVRCWQTTDMRIFCGHLRRFPHPWERATAALKYRNRVATGAEAAQSCEFNAPDFDRWFELVTDPVHVDTVRRHYQTAHEGAIR